MFTGSGPSTSTPGVMSFTMVSPRLARNCVIGREPWKHVNGHSSSIRSSGKYGRFLSVVIWRWERRNAARGEFERLLALDPPEAEALQRWYAAHEK